jgi:hypothetical protein
MVGKGNCTKRDYQENYKEVQILSPRPVFVRNVVEKEDCHGVAENEAGLSPSKQNNCFELRLGRPFSNNNKGFLRTPFFVGYCDHGLESPFMGIGGHESGGQVL